MNRQIIQSVKPPAARASSLEHWLTVFVLAGSGLVYLSLMIQSLFTFVIGESVCAIAAPFILWFEREKIRHWWHARWKTENCDQSGSVQSSQKQESE